MAVYVYNSPIVISKNGGSKNVCFTVDGGKRISQWSNLRSSTTWLSVEFDGTDYEEGIQYQYFNVTATKTTQTSERYSIVYADYTAEDGSTDSIRFTVYQEATGGITTSANNPLMYGSEEYQREMSPTIVYNGVSTQAVIDTPTWSSSYFDVYATAGMQLSGGYAVEYDIYPKQYNVTNEDITGTATFSYTNPTTSVKNYYTLHLNQKRCLYPFGITRLDGGEILVEGVGINTTRRIRGIDFKGQTLRLASYFPYAKGAITAKLDWEYDWVTLKVGSGMIEQDIAEEQYTLEIAESFQTGVRSFKINVEYQSLDGNYHSDSVQVIQNASDGSNLTTEVTANVLSHKFKYDGTPELYGYSRIRYIGNLTPKTPIVDVDWLEVGSPTLVESNGDYNKLYEYPITVHLNESTEVRTTKVRYYATVVGNESSSYGVDVTYIQARYPDKEPIVTPDIPVEGDEYIGQIWKDVEYDFGWNESVEYAIYRGDTPIFISRTHLRPNSNSNTILVNKICQNYLDAPKLVDSLGKTDVGYEEFKLCSVNGSVVYKTYKFINDWSYSKDFKTGILSHPILNDYTNVYYGQLLPFSVFATAEQIAVEYGIRYKDGYTDEYGEPIEDWITTLYTKDSLDSVNFPYDKRNYKNGVIGYKIGDTEYKLVDNCKVDYVLYYVNPWGGYDWFPIRGKVVENDEITQYTYTNNYNNTKWDFGKSRYLSEIHKKFQLNTHWLREEESLRMWYLLQSNCVYLHNIKTNEIYPVIITNSTQEHKKRGLTTSRISYQIEVELSQTRERL